MTLENDFLELIGKTSTSICDVIDTICLARFQNANDKQNSVLFIHNIMLNLAGNMLLTNSNSLSGLDKHFEDFKVNLDQWLGHAKDNYYKTKENIQ